MEKKHDGSKICVKRVEDLLSEAEKKSEGERNKAHWTKIKNFVQPIFSLMRLNIFHIRTTFISETLPILELLLTSYVLV